MRPRPPVECPRSGSRGRGVHQDQRTGSFRPRRGEQQRGRAGVELGHDRRPLAADLVQHRGQLLGIGLPWGQGVRREGVRGSGAAPVEQDQSAERCQTTQEQGGPRVLPGDVDVAVAAAGQHQVRWAAAEHLVGDPVPVQPGVPGLGLHGSPAPGIAQDLVPHGHRAGDDHYHPGQAGRGHRQLGRAKVQQVVQEPAEQAESVTATARTGGLGVSTGKQPFATPTSNSTSSTALTVERRRFPIRALTEGSSTASSSGSRAVGGR